MRERFCVATRPTLGLGSPTVTSPTVPHRLSRGPRGRPRGPALRGESSDDPDAGPHGNPVPALLPEPCGRVYRRDGCTVVALRDEIDIATAALIAPALDDATADGSPRLVVDLSEVSFLDCSGLTLLCRARRRALDREGRFWLVCACPRILRLLRAGRLHDVFGPVATPDEVFRTAGAGAPAVS